MSPIRYSLRQDRAFEFACIGAEPELAANDLVELSGDRLENGTGGAKKTPGGAGGMLLNPPGGWGERAARARVTGVD